MKLKGSRLDADGHLIERDDELFEYLEPPYKGNDSLLADRLDRSYEIWSGKKYQEFSDWLKNKPSEYIRSGRIYFSCEGGEASLPYAVKRLGHQVHDNIVRFYGPRLTKN